jgi:formylmethanofuran dehydrogenase subunit C
MNAGRLTTRDHVVTGSANVNNLNVSGTVSVNDLSVSGTATLPNIEYTNLAIPGTLDVTGQTTLGDINVNGQATLEGGLDVSGDVNALVFAAATQVSSTGNTDIRNSSGIDGDSLAIQGSPMIQGDLSISGNVYVGGNVFTGIAASVADVLNTTGLVPYG